MQSYPIVSTFCFRSICESNEQHDTEIDSARVMAEEDMTKHSENMIQCLDSKFSNLSLILPDFCEEFCTKYYFVFMFLLSTC